MLFGRTSHGRLLPRCSKIDASPLCCDCKRTSRRTSELLLSCNYHARWRLLPADYCQLETAVCPPADTNGIGLESDMWFGDKALVLRSDRAGVTHYCQLGKMAVNFA